MVEETDNSRSKSLRLSWRVLQSDSVAGKGSWSINLTETDIDFIRRPKGPNLRARHYTTGLNLRDIVVQSKEKFRTRQAIGHIADANSRALIG